MSNEQRLADALMQLLIGISMGWDLDGLIAKAIEVLHDTGHPVN